MLCIINSARKKSAKLHLKKKMFQTKTSYELQGYLKQDFIF